MVCNHKKRDGVHYCGDCGADLMLTQEEIDARDKFYDIYKELMDAKHPDAKFSRAGFDSYIKTKGATMAMQIIQMFVKDGKVEVTENKDDVLLNLEKEKLAILKDISSKLSKSS